MRKDHLGRPQTDEFLSIEHVAVRAQLLSDREDRALVFALQARAIAEKGLSQFALRLLRTFPDRLEPDILRQIGKPASGYYSHEQVRAIRREFPGWQEKFPLKGETMPWHEILDDPEETHYPSKYHYNEFAARFQAEFESLDRKLENLCYTDDVTPSKWKPWFFPRLIESCQELLKADAESETVGLAETTVTRSIFRAAEVSAKTGKLTLVYGPTRLGKTFAATKFQKTNSGRFRYIEVPAFAEDKEFFRELAMGLGIIGAKNLTASESRMVIEDVLRAGDICLILDEAHFLLGSAVYPRSIPRRIAWICSLVNKGVGIVLITVPKFLKTLENLGKNTPWDPDQLFGRIAETFPLPNELGREDLIEIAKKWLPSDDEKAFGLLADIALATPEFLGAIQSTSQRAIEIARSRGRDRVSLLDLNDAAFSGSTASIRPETRIQEPCKTSAKVNGTRMTTEAESASPRFTLPKIDRSTAIETTETAGK